MGAYWKVLYTKQLTKKRKTYQDGYVICKENGSAALLDEDGATLCNTRILVTQTLTEDVELKCFDGYLVNVDCKCEAKDLPQGCGSALNQVAQKSYCKPAVAAEMDDKAPAARVPIVKRRVFASAPNFINKQAHGQVGGLHQPNNANTHTSSLSHPSSKVQENSKPGDHGKSQLTACPHAPWQCSMHTPACT